MGPPWAGCSPLVRSRRAWPGAAWSWPGWLWLGPAGLGFAGHGPRFGSSRSDPAGFGLDGWGWGRLGSVGVGWRGWAGLGWRKWPQVGAAGLAWFGRASCGLRLLSSLRGAGGFPGRDAATAPRQPMDPAPPQPWPRRVPARIYLLLRPGPVCFLALTPPLPRLPALTPPKPNPRKPFPAPPHIKHCRANT